LKVSTASNSLSVVDYFETSNTVSESAGDIDLGSGGTLVLPDLTDTSGTVHHLAWRGEGFEDLRRESRLDGEIQFLW